MTIVVWHCDCGLMDCLPCRDPVSLPFSLDTGRNLNYQPGAHLWPPIKYTDICSYFLGRPCGDGEAAEAFKALDAYQYVKSGVYIPYVLYVVQVQHIRLSDKFVTLMNYCFKTHKIRKKAPKNYLQHALINLLHGYLKQRLSDESFTHRQGNFQKQLKARVFTCNVLMSLLLPSSVLVT